MYIIGMEKWNEKDFDLATKAVFCLGVPFILFWAGVISASFSTSMLVHLAAMVPLYLFVFVCVNLSKFEDVRNGLMASLLLALGSLIFVIIAFLAGLLPDSDWFVTFGNVAIINAPVLFVFAFCGTICETFDFRIRDIASFN